MLDITGSYMVKRSFKSARHTNEFQYKRVQKVYQYTECINDIFYFVFNTKISNCVCNLHIQHTTIHTYPHWKCSTVTYGYWLPY